MTIGHPAERAGTEGTPCASRKSLIGWSSRLSAARGNDSPSAAAQNWPTRSVRLLLPLGPGSGADIGARLIAEKLVAKWGQPVVVENRPGRRRLCRHQRIRQRARRSCAAVRPGLFVHRASLSARQAAVRSARSRAGRARVGHADYARRARRQLDVKSLGDLVAMARARPGTMNWATITGATDLVLAASSRAKSSRWRKFPTAIRFRRSTTSPKAASNLYWAALAIVRGAVQAGRIKLLAITASEPSAVVPGVPTVTQAGFPGAHLRRAGRLLRHPRHAATNCASASATDVREAAGRSRNRASRLHATGQEVVPGSAAEFAASIDKQRQHRGGHRQGAGYQQGRAIARASPLRTGCL